MCQLLESLKLNDGVVQNIGYHQNRLNRSMDELFPDAKKIILPEVISIPENCRNGIYKVRVLYRNTLEKVEIEPYHFRIIKSLKVVQHESIDYHLKYSDRQILQELFVQRGDCDDIIIVKNGLVTDSFAANLLFFDGNNWITPATPLLKGSKRQFLLESAMISEREVRIGQIHDYQQIGLINALVDFEEMPIVPIESVFF